MYLYAYTYIHITLQHSNIIPSAPAVLLHILISIVNNVNNSYN